MERSSVILIYFYYVCELLFNIFEGGVVLVKFESVYI